MTDLLIRSGLVLDETGEREADVLVEGGRVVAVAPRIAVPAAALVLDAGGCVVAPGLVDLHTHLREPGGEESELIETGTRAAALGGFTAVVAMPNTDPPIDDASVVRDVLALAEKALAHVAVAGAITVGRAGERMAPIAEMASAGVRMFTDDGNGVQDGGLMRRALEYARPLGVVLAEHCEDRALAAGGHMNEGAWSSRLGIAGQPALAEEAMLARDLGLVRLTGCPMHFLHLSTVGSATLMRQAKGEGLPATAEVTPHHLWLTDAEVASYDAVFKVNPPLRTAADVGALRAAVGDGIFDAIATDHAPHSAERKDEPFDLAPPGMTGLETAIAAAHTVLCAGEAGSAASPAAAAGSVAGPSATGPSAGVPSAAGPSVAGGGTLPLRRLLALLSWQPARIAQLAGHGGPIGPGAPANICVFDPGLRWRVDPSLSASRSRNTPFAGRELIGRVRHTVLAGEPVVIDGEAQR